MVGHDYWESLIFLLGVTGVSNPILATMALGHHALNLQSEVLAVPGSGWTGKAPHTGMRTVGLHSAEGAYRIRRG